MTSERPVGISLVVALWHLDPVPAAVPIAADAVSALFGAEADTTTAQCMLGFFGRLVQVDYLALVEYRSERQGGGFAPELKEGHARQGVRNVTPDCFALYRQHFWQHDEGTRIAERVRANDSAGVAAMHVRADDIHVPQWREEIYERARLADRLNFFYSPAQGRVFAVNLYRDRSRGGFGDTEIGRLLDVAGLLRQAHRLSLMTQPDPLMRRGDLPAEIDRASAVLVTKVPELSPEKQRCAHASPVGSALTASPQTLGSPRRRSPPCANAPMPSWRHAG